MNEMVQRYKNGFWYANVWYEGIRLRDCLNTDDRKVAQRRLADLYNSNASGRDLGLFNISRNRADRYSFIAFQVPKDEKFTDKFSEANTFIIFSLCSSHLESPDLKAVI